MNAHIKPSYSVYTYNHTQNVVVLYDNADDFCVVICNK